MTEDLKAFNTKLSAQSGFFLLLLLVIAVCVRSHPFPPPLPPTAPPPPSLLFPSYSLCPPFSRSVILWWRDVRVDSTLPRCSVSLRSPGFPSSMLLTRDNTCFSRSSILLWSRSLRLFACTELLLLLNCCQGGKKRLDQCSAFFFFF